MSVYIYIYIYIYMRVCVYIYVIHTRGFGCRGLGIRAVLDDEALEVRGLDVRHAQLLEVVRYLVCRQRPACDLRSGVWSLGWNRRRPASVFRVPLSGSKERFHFQRAGFRIQRFV